MKTSGVVFDFYDDPTGSVLKQAFPTAEELPEMVKTAHILTYEERDVLRDDAYALKMSNEGMVMRKFACVDAGNTLLSMLYLEKAAEVLPDEAVRVAAANIAEHALEFELELTPFMKSMTKVAFMAPGSMLNAKNDKGQRIRRLPSVMYKEKTPGNVRPEDMGKTAASGMSRTRDSMRQPMVGDEADWAQRTNLVSVRGGADSGRVIPTANQMKTAGVEGKDSAGDIAKGVAKHIAMGAVPGAIIGGILGESGKGAAIGAAAGGALGAGVGNLKKRWDRGNKAWDTVAKKHGLTEEQLHQVMDDEFEGRSHDGTPLGRKVDKVHNLAVKLRGKMPLYKTSGVGGGGVTLTDDVKDNGPDKKNPAKPHPGPMKDPNSFSVGQGKGDLEVNYKHGVLDVSGKSAKPKTKSSSAEHMALGRYPLDSYGDVQAATHYFEEHWTELQPSQRHEFAVKTAARADELGIKTSEMLSRYGSTEYASDIEAHIASRKASAPREFSDSYNLLKEKRSSVTPDQFVELLTEVDKAAGLNWHYGNSICDPYLATYGGKEKSSAADPWSWQGSSGERVNAEQLQSLANTDAITKTFSSEVAEAFNKDPVGIFESMPDTTKTIMAKLALGD
jgi:hypothetical protein